jgi:hypothetical protein
MLHARISSSSMMRMRVPFKACLGSLPLVDMSLILLVIPLSNKKHTTPSLQTLASDVGDLIKYAKKSGNFHAK